MHMGSNALVLCAHMCVFKKVGENCLPGHNTDIYLNKWYLYIQTCTLVFLYVRKEYSDVCISGMFSASSSNNMMTMLGLKFDHDSLTFGAEHCSAQKSAVGHCMPWDAG